MQTVDDELERLSQPPPERTTLTVETLMQPLERLLSKPAISVNVGATVQDAVEEMRRRGYGAICVTEQGRLVGIVTERDLVLRVVGPVSDFTKLKVREVMTPDPMSLRKEDPIVYVMHNMQAGGYRHVPIVDEDDRPVSIASIKDVVRFVVDHFATEILNLPPQPYRGPKRREGA